MTFISKKLYMATKTANYFNWGRLVCERFDYQKFSKEIFNHKE